MKRYVTRMSVLPGQPLDGSGIVCIHLFVPDPHGPFSESHVLQIDKVAQAEGKPGVIFAGPKQGRLACDSKRLVAPVQRKGVFTITPRSDDPRAVTCLKCKRSADYDRMMKFIESQNGAVSI